MANKESMKSHIIWDDIECIGKSAELGSAAMTFGVNHTFTVYQKDETGENYFHFATSHMDAAINYTYLSNLDLLNMFINQFKIKIRASSALNEAYDIRFSINENKSHFVFPDQDNSLLPSVQRNEFLQELFKSKSFPLSNGTALTMRQMLILYWLYNGKTVGDIASLLHLAEITVHKQINQLKSQVDCYTQFQLGVFFSSLSRDIKDLITLTESIINQNIST